VSDPNVSPLNPPSRHGYSMQVLFPFIIPNIICLCTVTRCPDRSGTIQDGYRRCHPSSDMVLGTVCWYGCYQGHTLKGAPSRIECTDTGKWSNRDEPYCESKEILFVGLRISIIINFFNKCNKQMNKYKINIFYMHLVTMRCQCVLNRPSNQDAHYSCPR
jgi:hypothetical protein